MRTFTVAVCAALVGALIGAWTVHLSEGNARMQANVQTQGDQIVELGRRLNLCLVARLDDTAKAKE